MCFVFIWEQTATCATYSINWLVFITEMKSVYSAVRTEYLYNSASIQSSTWVSSVSIIPPAVHPHLHLHASLTRRANGRRPENFWRNAPSDIRQQCIASTWIYPLYANRYLWTHPSNAELNPICHLLALIGAQHILHISGLMVKFHLPSAGIIRSSPYSPR